jgi:hypothetical protein
VNNDEGYSISYVDGDVCDIASGMRYQSHVNYVCDAAYEYGRPKLVDYPGLKGTEELLNL